MGGLYERFYHEQPDIYLHRHPKHRQRRHCVQFFLFTDFCKYFTVKCMEFEISKQKIVSIFDKII